VRTASGTDETVSRIAVVALGGNALVRDDRHQSIPDQYVTVQSVAPPLVDLVEDGWRLVVAHGNGPQVGYILRRSEIARAEVAPVPVDYAVGDTQGAIGYMFQKAIGNELRRRARPDPVVTVVTQTIVDADDPAFGRPTKQVGAFMDRATADRHAAELGWTIVEEPGRGWRRAVASPAPRAIVELPVIAGLLETGAIVIAVGGGGIPVARTAEGDLVGVEAVVDKDRAAALAAIALGADLLAIPTAVPQVAIDYGRPSQRWLSRLDVAEATALAASGQFGEGSMRPKVDALVSFVSARPTAAGVVCAIEDLPAALRGDAGTRITA
jgi:carbamate kinase